MMATNTRRNHPHSANDTSSPVPAPSSTSPSCSVFTHISIPPLRQHTQRDSQRCRFHRKNGRSRAPPLQRVTQTIPQKGADQQIRSAPSIDGNYSKATAHKFDTSVSGGAYQDARKVTTKWNARPKHWFSPKIRGRKHQTVTQRPFSPPSFPARRKRRGRRRRPAGANLRQPLSQPAADSSPARGALGRAFYSANDLPFRTVWRMKRKVAGSPCSASMVSRKRRRFIVFGWTRRDSCARSRYCRADASV